MSAIRRESKLLMKERPKTRSMKERDEKDVFKMIGKRVDSG